MMAVDAGQLGRKMSCSPSHARAPLVAVAQRSLIESIHICNLSGGISIDIGILDVVTIPLIIVIGPLRFPITRHTVS
jgi:hypothetical protein